MADPQYKIAEPFGFTFGYRAMAIEYALELFGERVRCVTCQGVKYVGNFIQRNGQGRFSMNKKCRNCHGGRQRYVRCINCGELTPRTACGKVNQETKK